MATALGLKILSKLSILSMTLLGVAISHRIPNTIYSSPFHNGLRLGEGIEACPPAALPQARQAGEFDWPTEVRKKDWGLSRNHLCGRIKGLDSHLIHDKEEWALLLQAFL